MNTINFKKPDLNAPRRRRKCATILSIGFYKMVQEKYSNLKPTRIKEIIRTYGEVIQDFVITYPEGVVLPEQIGVLFIGSCPATRYGNVDYKMSYSAGELVKYNNNTTEGLTGKIFYTNHYVKYRFKYNDLWGFKPVRQFKRKVSAFYRNDYEKYIKVNRNDRLRHHINNTSFRPINFLSALTEVEKKTGIELCIVKYTLDLYFKQIVNSLVGLKYPRLSVLNLGTFSLRRTTAEKKLIRKIDLLEKLLANRNGKRVIIDQIVQEVKELENVINQTTTII